MPRRPHLVSALLLLMPLSACLTPSLDQRGYLADEVLPSAIKPGEDTRSSVLAQLGSPSTKSLFDEDTWIYSSELQTRLAYFKPEVADRMVIAIQFGTDDKVEEVLQYTAKDGEVIQYAQRETPTRGRELNLWEQIFGSVGSVRLPGSDEITPDNPTGRRRDR